MRFVLLLLAALVVTPAAAQTTVQNGGRAVSITLPEQHWNIIFEALKQRPFGEVAGVVQAIVQQYQQQTAPKPQDAPKPPEGEPKKD